ncbi:hypothetical protein [Pandoraea sp. CB10b_02]|uniref:hypothetical protein n=1 Tax=Pandoraea sp. CB10b_02 TaxID=2014535 RepID=UPI00257B7023|nr:hypothetical protein [Pandoraea sp. CB10b_02]
MPTAEWREEKSELVVQAICRVLASPDLPQEARHELGNDALWNALKLHADALQERIGGTRWSSGLVDHFREHPEKCDEFLALMQEQDFTIDVKYD